MKISWKKMQPQNVQNYFRNLYVYAWDYIMHHTAKQVGVAYTL